MTNQRRWKTVAIAATLGIAAAGVGVAVSGRFTPGKPEATGKTTVAATVADLSPLAALAGGIAQGNDDALARLCEIVAPKDGQPANPAVADAEVGDVMQVLQSLRTGFKSYKPAGRAMVIAAASRLLNRFAVDPAPRPWVDALHPTHDLFVAGLADRHVDVRSSALNVVGSHWGWLPGRTMTPNEESILAEWKDAFVKPATRCLGDAEPKSRAAAVVCLGAAALDSVAAPAAAYVEDPTNGGVRYKAMMVFANRPDLLTEDTLLKRLHDAEPGIPQLAEMILKNRGLTKDQIYLGKQMDDPRPEVRASVIPSIRDRTDIDPTVWLLQLSRDTDETVRTKAAEALGHRESPEVDRRLREMANSDTSATVRAAAAEVVARLVKATTAALPSLPGAEANPAGLTIRAN